MYVHVYVCMYMSVHVHVYIYIYMCVCVYICMHVCVYVCIYACVCMYICVRPTAFLLLIFISTTLRYSFVNFPSLKSSWISIIFVRGVPLTLGEFPSRFLKCSFHI